MKLENSRRRGFMLWALLGAATLVAAMIALAVLGAGGGVPLPTATASGQANDPSPSPTVHSGGSVDANVLDLGWVPEPITQNPDVYARAALEAAGTFDTQLAARSEWVAWLETWFTPSPLYDSEQDALDQMAGLKAELDQAVLLPQQIWDDLANEGGRVSASAVGEVHYLKLPETAQNNMWTATSDVVMTYTRSADGGEITYDETVRVSVQVVCGGESVPTPDSPQQAGDCKVIRFFDAPVG